MCMSPLLIHYNYKEKKYQFNYNPETCMKGREIIVPCGHCPECVKKWKSQLAQRARIEMARYGYHRCCFLTITVNNESIDEIFPNGSLNHDYFQKFIKRLRAKLEYHGFKGKIKYLMCGEYGHLNGRPHFHALLFGWKPHDLKTVGKRSKKGYLTWYSNFLSECWRKVGASKEDIKKYNEKYGTKYDYYPLGMVAVGDVSENTAPYLAKYIGKFKEIKGDEFVVNGRHVRKPYMIYPKKILGIDYFIEHFREILARGFLRTSRGKIISIPKNWLKICEREGFEYMLPAFNEYQKKIKAFIYKKNCEIAELLGLGSVVFAVDTIHSYMCSEGQKRRMIYEIFKNVHR